jgi:hypothetical protein
MAALSGTRDITLEKPYLTKLANALHKGESITFVDNKKERVRKTQPVRDFIQAVRRNDEVAAREILKSTREYQPIFNNRRWIDIDRDQFYKLSSADATTTKMQENASLFSIQKGIEHNGYTDFRTFILLYRDDLLKIYPDMNEDWERTFFQQQLKIYREVGNTKYRHYSRDDGFMKFITDLVRTLYGISRKDTWNPADVWLVSEYGTVKREIQRIIRDNETSLQELNSILRSMFHERKIVGVSLKLMSGQTAKWELVNLEKEDVFDNGEYQFSIDTADLSFKLKPTKKDFENADSKIFMGSRRTNVKLQIRRSETKFSNLSIEGTDLQAPTARLGNAPIDMVARLFRSANLEAQRWRSWKNYPSTAEEYEKEKAKHEQRFKQLMNTKQVKFGVPSATKFSENIMAVFENGDPVIANTKLNQLDLLNEIFKLRGDSLNNFLTSLAYFCQKKGKVFGPFAKVY